jgi:DNA-binding GntR family transcriptional regulator
MFEFKPSPLNRDKVYEALLDAIIGGRLKPGDRIRERDMADQMGISTTPVKEAIRRLETDGLVLTAPRRGAVVSDAALTSVREIVRIRADLESFGARLVAQRIDADGRRELDRVAALLHELNEVESIDFEAVTQGNDVFHQTIRELSRNRFIVHFVQVLSAFDRTVRHAALADPDEVARAFPEHIAIYEHIRDGRADAAEDAMRQHIMRTIDFVLHDID